MIGLGRRVPVYAYGDVVDMRKSFDTLSAIVREHIRHDVLDGALYVFVGKDRRRAKVLFWDGTGLCVLAKRLEKGKFAAPWAKKKSLVEWTTSELALFLEGSELVGRVALSPPAWTRAERRVVFR
ncbi:MAG TPA: IS66 family insertion sequence element accessory protein TnpB [Gammaproteobacteria bacterium]|nr:IS66 family insertion sequence element accessory protein TnpB [Gammaproteobacteria bacterium]